MRTPPAPFSQSLKSCCPATCTTGCSRHYWICPAPLKHISLAFKASSQYTCDIAHLTSIGHFVIGQICPQGKFLLVLYDADSKVGATDCKQQRHLVVRWATGRTHSFPFALQQHGSMACWRIRLDFSANFLLRPVGSSLSWIVTASSKIKIDLGGPIFLTPDTILAKCPITAAAADDWDPTMILKIRVLSSEEPYLPFRNVWCVESFHILHTKLFPT